MKNKYEIFIGLEIHTHLKTETKMFCSCRAQYGDDPNANVCPICLGHPGTLPQVNEHALELSYLMAAMLGCELSSKTEFARKNYFYPDMPKNYQISQFENPIGLRGIFSADLGNGVERGIRIHDVHLEEDAGKMIHTGDYTLLDFNRAGYPLLEIVTEPDLKSGEETEAFLRDFQRLVRCLGISDGNMEEGSLKCDANLSINLLGKGLGTRVELKNMNSPRFVRQGLNYEIRRQTELLDAGLPILQETRLWNENRDITESMRRKETSDDYRYFPEPDIPPFIPDDKFLNRIKNSLIETPLVLKKRLIDDYRLPIEQAEFIRDDAVTATLFEETVALGASARKVAAWLSSDVRKILNRNGANLIDCPLTPGRFNELLKLVDDGVISGKIAKKVLEEVFKRHADPKKIIETDGLAQISDPAVISDFIDRIFTENPQVVQDIRGGDVKQRGWIMGQIMQLSDGKASPDVAGKLLGERLLSDDTLDRKPD